MDANSNESPAMWANPAAETAGNAPPAWSVIIPTYRRPDALLRVLDGLARQRGVDLRSIEIVVADDGSGDDTPAMVVEWARGVPVRLLFCPSARNRGPAHARNRAVAAAGGALLLITGDDMLPHPDLLATHARWHVAHPAEPEALLGRVDWPDDPPPSAFMRWIASGGSAFYFSYPRGAGAVPADRFYTSNVSLKRALLKRCGGFDESFPFASHEDLELGQRLARTGGMRLHYDPAALAWHEHPLTLDAAFRRVYVMGYSSILYWKRTGATGGGVRRGLRAVLQRAAGARVLGRSSAVLVSVAGRRRYAPVLWRWSLSLAYWTGVGDAMRGRPASAPERRTPRGWLNSASRRMPVR